MAPRETGPERTEDAMIPHVTGKNNPGGGGRSNRLVTLAAALAGVAMLVPLAFAGPFSLAFAGESAATTAGGQDVTGAAVGNGRTGGARSEVKAADATASRITLAWDIPQNSSTQKLDTDGTTNRITPLTQGASGGGTLNRDSVALTAKINLNPPSTNSYPAGSIKVRIPSTLFDYETTASRPGGAQRTGATTIGPVECASDGSASTDGFCYTLDKDGAYVVTNAKDLTNGGGSFTVTYTYSGQYDYWTIPDKAEASLRASLQYGQTTVQSDPIKAIWNTSATLTGADKSNIANLTSGDWNADWGDKPAIAENKDLLYTVWLLKTNYGTNGRAFSVSFDDRPGDGGTVVARSAMYNGSYLSSDACGTTNRPSSKTDLNSKATVSYGADVLGSNPVIAQCIVVAYPKPGQDTAQKTFINRFTATLTTADGDPSATASKQAEAPFEYRKPTWVAPTGCTYTLGVTRSNRPAGLRDGYNHEGDMDRLLHGQSVEATDGGFVLAGHSSPYCQQADSRPSYTTVLANDLVSMDDTLLGDGDYEYDSYRFDNGFAVNELTADPATGSYKEQASSDWAHYPIRELWGRKTGGDTWTRLATCTYSDSKTCQPGDLADGVSQGDSQYNGRSVTFTGYAGLQERVTTDGYSVDMKGVAGLRILPSKTVKGLVSAKYGKDGASVNVRDYATLDVKDHGGERVGFAGSPQPPTPAEVQTKILERDQEEYGGSMYHASDNDLLLKYSFGSVPSLTGAATPDPGNKRFKIQYRAEAYEYAIRFNSNADADKAVEDGTFTPQREGTFHVLLPKGMTVELKTVRAATSAGTPADVISVEFHADWQNSGRTLMVVKAKAKNENNHKFDGSRLTSGLAIEYTAYYDWFSAAMYGNQPSTDTAYETGNTSIAGGWGAGGRPGTDPLNPSLIDPSAGDAKRFLYGADTQTLTGDTFSWAGLDKKVHEVGGGEWSDGQDGSVSVEAETGQYQYRLAFTPDSKDGRATDMTLYDSLESCTTIQNDKKPATCDDTWKGVLQKVDVSQPQAQGATPTVYKSEKPDLNLSGTGPNVKDRDLTDTGIWKKVDDPGNADQLENATAIAISFGDYEASYGTWLSVVLTMDAPRYTTGRAYNQSWMTGRIKAAGPAGQTENTTPIGSNLTMVTLRQPPLKPVVALPLTGGAGTARLWAIVGCVLAVLAILTGVVYHTWRMRRMRRMP